MCFSLCGFSFASCGLSLVAESEGSSLVAGYGLLTAVTSLAVKHSLQSMSFSSCGARAQLPLGMWDIPRLGTEPMSPALVGGFLTTGQPGKSWRWHFSWDICCRGRRGKGALGRRNNACKGTEVGRWLFPWGKGDQADRTLGQQGKESGSTWQESNYKGIHSIFPRTSRWHSPTQGIQSVTQHKAMDSNNDNHTRKVCLR